MFCTARSRVLAYMGLPICWWSVRHYGWRRTRVQVRLRGELAWKGNWSSLFGIVSVASISSSAWRHKCSRDQMDAPRSLELHNLFPSNARNTYRYERWWSVVMGSGLSSASHFHGNVDDGEVLVVKCCPIDWYLHPSAAPAMNRDDLKHDTA